MLLMTVFNSHTKFWGQWFLYAFTVFVAFFLFPSNNEIGRKQVSEINQGTYSPFEVNHFSIGIRPEDFEFLFSDRPRSFFAYQDAELVINRTPVVYGAKMRIRGTHAWNWDKPKPSIRLRLRGQKKILARETLDFINPDDASMLANLVADYLAAKMKIPSPRTTICTVAINDDYKGLYHLAESMSPETLVRQGFPGCSIVEGNLRNSKMWHHPELWEIHGQKGVEDSAPLNCLAKLLKIVETPVDLARIEDLSKLVDIERFASWSALITAIGSIHTNDFLGNVLVYEPVEGKLFPAISDSTGFGVITSMAGMHEEVDVKVPPYEFLTPLLNAFFRVPEFQFRRNLALYRLLNHDLHPDKLAQLVNRFLSVLKPLYLKETYASALINVPIVLFSRKIPVSPETQLADAFRLLEFMKARRDFLLGLLNENDAVIDSSQRRSLVRGKWYRHMVVKVSGHCPVEWDFSSFKGKILPDFDFDGVLDEPMQSFYGMNRFYPALKELRKAGPLWLMLDRRWASFELAPDAQTYVLGVCEENLDQCLEFLKNNCKNSVTGKSVELVYSGVHAETTFLSRKNPLVLHPWRWWKK